jgi:hypothetical protein
MEQTLHLLYLLRGLERLLIEAGAILCVVAGTLLYRWNVAGDMEASGTAGGASVKLSHAAPGSVLALFGMVIMVVALTNPAKYEEGPGVAPSPSASAAAGGVAPPPSKTPSGTEIILYADKSTPVVDFLQTLRDEQPEAAKAGDELKALSERARGLVPKVLTGRELLLTEVALAAPADSKAAAAMIEDFHLRAKTLQ